jgi:hyperosmotically inducible protein
MKTNKNNWVLAMTLGLIIAAALPGVILLGLTGCAGDRYNRSTGEYIDDNSLKVRVSNALGNNPDYKFEHVNVTIFKGTVQLSGFVSLSAQKSKAGEIVKGVEGVRNVENNIVVQENADRTAGQYTDDKTLVSHVKDALSDNPQYKFDGVKVTALNGTVQLSGFVNTSDQKSKAAEIAKHTGARDVVNEITVKD